MVDWNQEVENLVRGTEFLKLSGGTHRLTFLDEGELKEVEYDGEKTHKCFFKVKSEDDGQHYTWTVTRGQTNRSLYGQIALFGKANGGLTGYTVNVIVKGDGKNRDYTVQEALELIKEDDERRKQPAQETVQ